MHKVILIVTVLGLAVALFNLAGLCETQQRECTVMVQPGESIQAAIDNAPDGAVICLTEGTWEENIQIAKPVTLCGQGPERSVIRASKEGAAVSIEGKETLVTVNGIGITGAHGGKGFGLMWGEISAQDFGCAIWIEGSARVTLNSCHFSGSYCGIVLRETAQASIINCTVMENARLACFPNFSLYFDRKPELIPDPFEPSTWIGCGVGIVLRDQSKATIADTTVAHNELHGIVLVNTAQATITGCSLSENTRGNGIDLSGSSHATIENSQFFENHTGVLLWDGSQAAITNCTISENSYGVSIVDNAQTVLEGNSIYSNKVVGISSWYRGMPRGQGNKMWNNGVDLVGNLTSKLRLPLVEATEQEISYPDSRYSTLQHAVDALVPGGRLIVGRDTHVGGITVGKSLSIVAASDTQPILQAPSPDSNGVISLVERATVVLQGVILTGGRCGVIAGGSVQATIIGGDISESSYGILLGNTAQANVTDSAIHGNGYGIVVWNTAKSVLKDCTISRNKEDGIVLGDSAQVTVQSSTVFSNGRDGLVLGCDAQATLQNSTVSENESYGIALELSAQAIITDCTVSENGTNSIILWDSSQATISNSTISGSKFDGIKLEDSAQVTISNCVISGNGGNGIDAVLGSQATISGSTISGNANGIVLRYSTQMTIQGSKIHNNVGYGVALYQRPCYETDSVFSGRISGKNNLIPGLGDPDGNSKGAVCPEDLSFLMTTEGGELDWRK